MLNIPWMKTTFHLFDCDKQKENNFFMISFGKEKESKVLLRKWK